MAAETAKQTSSLQHLRSAARRLFAQVSIYIAFALLLAIAEIASPAFLSGSNISNMLQQVAPLGIVVIGQTLVIVVRGLDLSVGSVMATAAVAATAFNGLDSDVFPIIGVSLLIGLGTGLANGLLITKRSVPPFLATLAMWIVLEGCRYAYNGGAPSGNVPAFFRVIGAGSFHGIPYNILIMAAIAAVFVVILHVSTFGRRVFLVGGNPVMARLVGIRVDRVVIASYVLSGLLAATAGLVLSGFVGLVDNFAAVLNSILSWLPFLAAWHFPVAEAQSSEPWLERRSWSLSRTQSSFSGFRSSFN